ncbi:hypothetical protein OESDEN_03663 [Oesophagostomum dentatum]|uniref:Tc1-like transposase DDE domain-containing protein n=1 Tax=Oesophagostomum dentatum TaxID=61180 RepID=A0A0B1TLT6_OESDE|nr:hypothetical protein OESDEN_03663 [Oesophagostomum dentatum]
MLPFEKRRGSLIIVMLSYCIATTDAATYQDFILKNTTEHSWIQKFFKDLLLVYQHDWAPSHGAKSTIALCQQLFPGFWGKDLWPSNSPDLNPVDFSVWTTLEANVFFHPYRSLDL